MIAAPISFTFDWDPGEHARVTSLLIREQVSSGLWRDPRTANPSRLEYGNDP